MLVVMAVDAQQLPVAAVEWIVAVVMVSVMDSQFTQLFAGKLPAAFCTDPWKNFKCLISVIFFFHSFFLS